MVETTSEEGDSNALAKISSPALAAESKPNERYVVSIRRNKIALKYLPPGSANKKRMILMLFVPIKVNQAG
jgi:hypothetical protein